MHLTLKTLPAHLKKTFSSCYIISTDEYTLAQDARNQIISAAQSAEFLHRDTLHIESAAHWQNALLAAQNDSLFGLKKIVDIRAHHKLDATAQSALEKLVQCLHGDMIVMITIGKLTPAQQKA